MSRIGAAIAASVIFCAPMASADGATTTGHASVVLLSSTAVAETGAMNFNVGSSATGGSVQLNPQGNIRAGAALRPGAQASPSTFTVQGEPFAAVTISLGDGAIVTGPGSALSVQGFAHSAGPTPALDRLGGLTFTVGATLAIGSSQPPGRYSGTYTVTVNY
jgi:Domain of unknown function (DUF4402)